MGVVDILFERTPKPLASLAFWFSPRGNEIVNPIHGFIEWPVRVECRRTLTLVLKPKTGSAAMIVSYLGPVTSAHLWTLFSGLLGFAADLVSAGAADWAEVGAADWAAVGAAARAGVGAGAEAASWPGVGAALPETRWA